MRRFDAVLFDLDGTLLNSKPLIAQSVARAWRKVLSIAEPPPDKIISLIGLPMSVMVGRLVEEDPGARAVARENSVDEIVMLHREYFLTHETLLAPFDGCIELLTGLRAHGIRLGIVTSKTRIVAGHHLTLFGLDRLVDTAVFMEDTERHKPDSAPFSLAASRLAVAPSSCLGVGDAVADLLSARAAGMAFCAAMWGADPRDPLVAAKPDYLAESPTDVLGIGGVGL